jgi:peroxiredoxin
MILQFQTMILALLMGFVGVTEETTGYKVGDKARDFSLKNIDGKMVSLADYKDAKGVIVIFTCNHCPYSKLYEDRIIEINNKYAAKGFPVVAINPNDPNEQPEDSFAEMQKRAKEKGFTFPYIVDETQEITKTYGATRTPHVYLLEKKGKDHVVAYIGAIDNNHKSAADADKKFLEDALNEMIAGKKVSNNYTKAVGCTIKWAKAKS